MNTTTDDSFDNNYDHILDSEYEEVTAKEILDFSTSWDLPVTYSKIVRSYERSQVVEKAFTDRTKANRYIRQKKSDGCLVVAYDYDRMNAYEPSRSD